MGGLFVDKSLRSMFMFMIQMPKDGLDNSGILSALGVVLFTCPYAIK